VEQQLLQNLFGYEWELTKSPAGAHQWTPKNGAAPARCRTRSTSRSARAVDADHGPRAAVRPGLRKISRRFYENPDQFADAFARAWFKLTHRDMGRSRAISARSSEGD
jgi:catalase-peroxidase